MKIDIYLINIDFILFYIYLFIFVKLNYLNLFNNMGCGVNSRPRGQKIIMLGLKNSGKTALCHDIVAGQKVHPASTIGINDDSF